MALVELMDRPEPGQAEDKQDNKQKKEKKAKKEQGAGAKS